MEAESFRRCRHEDHLPSQNHMRILRMNRQEDMHNWQQNREIMRHRVLEEDYQDHPRDRD
ncbi:hypothetical protein BDV25DRAFT_160043 [Aspergillus avenaceus]|uniref:Uncharacterized protein n=1 Tax=Aspergillus avenaceus TaxID=36643 RepID=A0A5N6TML0_ASPAV|nr:hypothetical protein BDV25DRAFT_160043 [Aspergillus avenaceus]